MNRPKITEYDPWLKPFEVKISERKSRFENVKNKLAPRGSLTEFANGHLYYGLHNEGETWILREWAPNATGIFLIGSFNNWKEDENYAFSSSGNGNWELVLPEKSLHHLDSYKIKIYWNGGSGERIPAWSRRVVQEPESMIFNAQVWFPDQPYVWKNESPVSQEANLLIYEAHTGMATEDFNVGSFSDFREKILPRIKKAGYNTVQLMAIQEHPYYGSFGYHVSSFFAPSSRFGTPEDLKALIDEAHGMGLRVIMDLIHSHAVKNELEGLGNYDGSPWQFFHDGPRRNHVAWDSLCFNYGKDGVIHFLLSNCQYWLKEFHFDGFRFDGITSMIYLDHGLNRDFTSYDMYFDGQQDEDAITYLSLANKLCKEINTHSITIAEEMSGYPGLAVPTESGGIGFDYRMAMGTPDYWIKIIKEKPDEYWNMEEMFYELTRKRAEEKTVGYAESHDQALVGDKTIIFRLIDSEMYNSMSTQSESLKVDRGIALHKMIRLVTLSTSGNAYLNFMGNEFGHPEWIDFPREGNNWSYQYARRQWSLVDDESLKYQYLCYFDRQMIKMAEYFKIFSDPHVKRMHINNSDKILAFERAGLLFLFNFHPENSYPSYGVSCKKGKYKIILSSDTIESGGMDRINKDIEYRSIPEKSFSPNQMLKIYLPSRTAVVLESLRIKSVY